MWVLLAVLVLIAVLAPRYGADSRWPGPGEPPVPPRARPSLRADIVRLTRQAVHFRSPRTTTSTGRQVGALSNACCQDRGVGDSPTSCT